jgi:DNA-directed RNA polymerase subunit RPC12/RpoP
MIRYRCPRCHATLESPDYKAGLKVTCANPKCGQRLQVPGTPPNKTLLADPVSLPSSTSSTLPSAPSMKPSASAGNTAASTTGQAHGGYFPVCGRTVQVESPAQGSTARCPQCNNPLVMALTPATALPGQPTPAETSRMCRTISEFGKNSRLPASALDRRPSCPPLEPDPWSPPSRAPTVRRDSASRTTLLGACSSALSVRSRSWSPHLPHLAASPRSISRLQGPTLRMPPAAFPFNSRRQARCSRNRSRRPRKRRLPRA